MLSEAAQSSQFLRECHLCDSLGSILRSFRRPPACLRKTCDFCMVASMLNKIRLALRKKYCAPCYFCLSLLFFLPHSLPVQAAGKSGDIATRAIRPGRAMTGGKGRELPKRPLGMVEAVESALAANPSLGGQEAQARSSEEYRKSRRGTFGPSLGMTYSASKLERESSPSTSKPPELGTWSFGINVTQPVFQGLRLLANYQAAALQADSDRAALRNAELNMTQQVQTAFLACLAADENVRSESEALARLQDQLRITRAFYDVGLRPRLDVLQAEVDVSQAESSLVVAENTRDTGYAQLNTLLGFPANAPISFQGKLAHTPFRLTLEQCLQKAYVQRPDLFMAKKAVEIARKDQLAVQSDYYPHIEAYYRINQQGNTPDMQRMGDQGSRSSTWEIGATATWNVFQWGVTWYDDKRAGWQVTRMRHEEESMKLDVGYEIKSRFLAVREAEKRISLAEKAIAQAREAYEAALARYREQVGTNFDVLDASSNLTRAEANLTSARADYLTALAQLYAAMGEYHPDLLRP